MAERDGVKLIAVVLGGQRLDDGAGGSTYTSFSDTRTLYKNIMVYAKSFADVNVGEPLLYVNSLDCVAVAINQGSFSKAYNIGTGIKWRIALRKAPRIVYE